MNKMRGITLQYPPLNNAQKKRIEREKNKKNGIKSCFKREKTKKMRKVKNKSRQEYMKEYMKEYYQRHKKKLRAQNLEYKRRRKLEPSWIKDICLAFGLSEDVAEAIALDGDILDKKMREKNII